jgi:hypothetical protein
VPRGSVVQVIPERLITPLSDELFGQRSIRRALALRAEGVTYTDIAIIMRIYHGDVRSLDAWRFALRAAGASARVREEAAT